MRALASQQFGLGSIPAQYLMWVDCLLLALALLRGFFSWFSGFPPSTKNQQSKRQLDQDRGLAWKPAKTDVALFLINFTSLLTVPATWVLCVHTKGLVPALILELVVLGFYLNNKVFLFGNYRLIVVPGKFDGLKTNTLWADSVSPRMNNIASRDRFKPIRIGENLPVNYNAWYNTSHLTKPLAMFA